MGAEVIGVLDIEILNYLLLLFVPEVRDLRMF
jgi:hypothetical protein